MTRQWSTGAILVALLALVIIAVLLAPASETGGSLSSLSSGPSGARLGYDLASRFGWRTERREVPFSDSAPRADVQVLLHAVVAAPEAQALLDHVRRGGSLLVVGPAGALADSLPVVEGEEGFPVPQPASRHCKSATAWDVQLTPFRQLTTVAWRRPAPPDTVGFGRIVTDTRGMRAGVGYPLGAGRVVIVPDTAFVVNDMLRRCDLEADVTFIRILEYLSRDQSGARIAFDEYHHGAGVHGGSLAAMRMYLAGTGSGRMLAQLAIAGLLLLLAAAPRPLAPRDPPRVVRRSPLEHADALAHAYQGVGATRTATSRLLAGVRRRARRDRTKTRESDEQLLAVAAAMSPAAANASRVVSQALATPIDAKELPTVARALETIEVALTARPSSLSRS